MRVKKSYIVAALAIVLSFLLGSIVQAVTTQASAEPGSDSDPLVTQGYVDKKDDALTSSVNKVSDQSKFVPLEIAAGKQLLTGEGTEIILRSGAAKAIRGTGGGLSDISSGKDILTEGSILYNHLIISARDDGRGIKATKSIWVLVKGPYEIK